MHSPHEHVHLICEYLFIRCRSRIFSKIFAVVAHIQTAEDLTQDIFLELARTAHTLVRTEHNLEAWLYGAARARLDRWHASQRVCPEVLVQDANRHPEDPSDHFSAITLREEVASALSALNPLARTIFFLSLIHGFSLQEIADRLTRSPGEVRRLLHASCHSLRDRLSHAI